MIKRRRPSTRGFVLITVLWVGLGLLLAVSVFLSSSRQDALSIRAEIATVRALELARSGLNVALADLGRINENQHRTARDGTPVVLRMAEGQVTYRIIDEGGKINILQAPQELLSASLVEIGNAAGIDGFQAVNFAESLSNFTEGPDGNLRSVYSTLTAAGLGSATALNASRYLTTLSFSSTINPRTASPTVLEAVPGIGPSDINEIIARREAGRTMPPLGTATAWFAEREGPVYTIEANAVLTMGGQVALRVQVAQKGVSFRGGLMRYEVLSYQIIR